MSGTQFLGTPAAQPGGHLRHALASGGAPGRVPGDGGGLGRGETRAGGA